MDIIGTKNLRDVIELKVSQFPDKECIVFEDREENVIRYSYTEFNMMINKYANILLDKGIKKGTRLLSTCSIP